MTSDNGYTKMGAFVLVFLTASDGKFAFDLKHCQIQISRHCGCLESKPKDPSFCVSTISPNRPPLGPIISIKCQKHVFDGIINILK